MILSVPPFSVGWSAIHENTIDMPTVLEIIKERGEKEYHSDHVLCFNVQE